jgi:hypothetical protein
MNYCFLMMDRLFRILEQSLSSKARTKDRIPNTLAGLAIMVKRVMNARLNRGLFP